MGSYNCGEGRLFLNGQEIGKLSCIDFTVTNPTIKIEDDKNEHDAQKLVVNFQRAFKKGRPKFK